MNWSRLWTTVVVKDDERAILLRNGRFERLLYPGRFSELDPFGRLSAEVMKIEPSTMNMIFTGNLRVDGSSVQSTPVSETLSASCGSWPTLP